MSNVECNCLEYKRKLISRRGERKWYKCSNCGKTYISTDIIRYSDIVNQNNAKLKRLSEKMHKMAEEIKLLKMDNLKLIRSVNGYRSLIKTCLAKDKNEI